MYFKHRKTSSLKAFDQNMLPRMANVVLYVLLPPAAYPHALSLASQSNTNEVFPRENCLLCAPGILMHRQLDSALSCCMYGDS